MGKWARFGGVDVEHRQTLPYNPPVGEGKASSGGRGQRAALFVIVASAAFASSGPLARYARPAHPLLISAGRVAPAAVVLRAAHARGAPSALRPGRPHRPTRNLGRGG